MLLHWYNVIDNKELDLIELLQELLKKFDNESRGNWYELEYNVWCDDYDKESEQENIGKVLDSIIESIEDDLSDEIVDFDEYNKLYAMVLKLGGFNKLIKFPEKNIEVVFEDININTGKLIFKVWKNDKFERRSVDNIDDLNLTLYHPELFESVRRILRKLL